MWRSFSSSSRFHSVFLIEGSSHSYLVLWGGSDSAGGGRVGCAEVWDVWYVVGEQVWSDVQYANQQHRGGGGGG